MSPVTDLVSFVSRALQLSDPPPIKWPDLRYVFDIKEDCNGKEALQARREPPPRTPSLAAAARAASPDRSGPDRRSATTTSRTARAAITRAHRTPATRRRRSPVLSENSDSCIRLRDDASESLHRVACRGRPSKREVGPHFIIIAGVLRQNASKVPFVQHDHVVDALASRRPDQAFNMTILPGRTEGRRPVPDAHRPDASLEGAPNARSLSRTRYLSPCPTETPP